MVSKAARGSTMARAESNAAWITWLTGSRGKAKSRTSPESGRIKPDLARWGALRAKAAGSRVSTVAVTRRSKRCLAQARLSSSQLPTKPVPPVMKRWPPSSVGQSSGVRSTTSSRSLDSGCGATTSEADPEEIAHPGDDVVDRRVVDAGEGADVEGVTHDDVGIG
ncbi:MAG: hypothetical protein CAPSK01_002347 [Candidatus Accumulibacter vicinus]|uniref:Uncharacterized protein n=1 Tax=Candidatus Accumulibacter vicinus TaxID=2954382 RepID=A0A084XZ65_9PROT|nr:MAG: hypothetical protein CAPSK01_002347 [Candidatus Accumulibacter vicinus]